MVLGQLDIWIIVLFFVITMGLGLWAGKTAGRSTKDFFLSGRNMPWWLLGVSMVATTFSADTPNLVTDIVRNDGIQGNWVWWAYLLTGMLTVFIFSKLWRRSEVLTDLEFYDLRYSGNGAEFLRGFRAIYLGVVFNCLVMATVCLAAIKIGGIMLGLTPNQVLIGSAIIIFIYSAVGGLKGILLTDLFQFFLA
ncbi:MAG: Na+:solute symporter, partial [Saprospiraceae bacterium]|nr:Na+:solute symporter [Saprospiraceae bacterium]